MAVDRVAADRLQFRLRQGAARDRDLARLVDAAIIGLPPKPGTKGPAFYVSGDAASDIAVLGQLGLDLRLIEGPIGAASASGLRDVVLGRGARERADLCG